MSNLQSAFEFLRPAGAIARCDDRGGLLTTDDSMNVLVGDALQYTEEDDEDEDEGGGGGGGRGPAAGPGGPAHRAVARPSCATASARG